MNTFNTKNKQFWLNNEPVFIQAGEFHYYRTPPEDWPHRLTLLKDAGFNTVASYIPWLWHQIEEDLSDFDGHSHPMRNLEGFLDLAAEMGFLIIARPGPYIMAETINEGVPPWVFENYPQAAFISQDNKVQNVASYLHPDFLACVQKWYHAIFQVITPRQITHNGKIIMVQLDNEMGMIQWVRNIIDINPDTIHKFADYIRSSNYNLQGSYPQNGLEDYLREGIIDPDRANSAAIIEEYRRFYRAYLQAYASFLVDEARSNGMDVLPVVNIHGFANGGKTFPIGLSQLIDVMRLPGIISATDVYPGLIGEGNIHELYLVNEIMKALQNQDQPLFSIEFQSGGNLDFSNRQSSFYDLHTRLCISSGMRAINHYLFVAGENDPILSPVKRHDWGSPIRTDGSLRQHYHRYPKLSNTLASYGKDLVLANPEHVTTIGYQLDYFMTEVNTEATQNAAKSITHQRETILFDLFARGLTLSHRPFNVIDLDSDEIDVKANPVLWVMMEKQSHPATQQKLVSYVQQGGKLVLGGRMCVEDFDHNQCTVLKDALAIEIDEDDKPFTRRNITVFNHRDVPVTFIEKYKGDFSEVFAHDDKNEAIGFMKTLGKGKVIMLGASMPIVSLIELDLFEQVENLVDCPPLFEMTEWIDAQISTGENGSFLFISNYKDDPVDTRLYYQEKSLTGDHPIHLPARQGAILPIEWHLNDDILVYYVTAEIRKIIKNEDQLILEIAQQDFSAELTLRGYLCEGANTITESEDKTHVEVSGHSGKIILKKYGAEAQAAGY